MARILIIDDDSQTIKYLTPLIESFGHTPIFTLHPEYLFQFLDMEKADLILLDINMPGIDGKCFKLSSRDVIQYIKTT